MEKWEAEFGAAYAVPDEIRALANAGKLEDISWHNDVCPSFSVADGSVKLWVDHPEREQRECTPVNRFTVCLYDEGGDWLTDALRTDDVGEVIAYLADHFDVRP